MAKFKTKTLRSKRSHTENSSTSSKNGGPKKPFKGVRMRSWGSWVSEIRAPGYKTRIWLGSYSTAEAAARAYDAALLCLKGFDALSGLNFPSDTTAYITSNVELNCGLMSPKDIQETAAAAARSIIPSSSSTTSSLLPPSSSIPSSTEQVPEYPVMTSSSLLSPSPPIASSNEEESKYPVTTSSSLLPPSPPIASSNEEESKYPVTTSSSLLPLSPFISSSTDQIPEEILWDYYYGGFQSPKMIHEMTSMNFSSFDEDFVESRAFNLWSFS